MLLPIAGFAGPALTLGPGAALPGTAVMLPLSFDPDGGQVAALQWTFQFSPLQITSISVNLGTAAIAANKTAACAGQAGSYTCLLTGLNSDLIPSGIVANAYLTVAPGAGAASIPIQIVNTLGASQVAYDVAVTGAGAAITVSASSLSSLVCAPPALSPGATAACTLTLSAAAPSAISYAVSSDNPAVGVPASVTVAPGSNSASFPASAANPAPANIGIADIQVSSGIGSISAFIALVTGPIPPPAIASVWNGASYQPGAVAPGEVVTLFGTAIGPPILVNAAINPSTGLVSSSLANTQVLFGGIPGPMIYATSTQVAAIVPYELAGQTSINVQVQYLGVPSNAIAVPLATTAPGIFTLNAAGTGPAAILNQDGSTNGPANPADKGSVVVVYATGEGQTVPRGVDGLVTIGPDDPPPVLPVTASVGGQPATVIFAAEAPGIVAGVMQANIVIPLSSGSGSLPIVLTVGPNSSPPGVTVAVR